MTLQCVMIIWQHGVGVEGKECHLALTEVSSELLTFLAFFFAITTQHLKISAAWSYAS